MLLGFKPNSTKPADVELVLLKAAEMIEYQGLAKGVQQDEHGCVCVHGAFALIVHGEFGSWDYGLYREAGVALAKHIIAADLQYDLIPRIYNGVDPAFGGCASWNNHPNRTAEEVVDALRGAAQRVREGKPS